MSARRRSGARRRAAGLTLALTAALTLAACTGTSTGAGLDDAPTGTATPTGAGPTPQPTSPARTSTASTAGPPGNARGLSVALQARIGVPAGMRVVGLTLAGSRVAWSGCLPCVGTAQEATDVYVADLPAGRPRSVARTQFRLGGTSVVGLTGTTLVWIDGADVRDGDALRSRWALRALDLTSRASWTIAQGGRPGDPPQQPVASAGGGRVTWQLFDLAAGGGPVWSADLRTHAVRRVSGRLPGLLRAVPAQGLVYSSSDEAGRDRDPDGPFGGDAYLLPEGGGKALALTTTHDLAEATASDDHVLWTTQQGDAESLWWAPIPAGAPTLVFTGSVVGFVAGRGFAAWTTRESEPVVEVGAGGPPVTLPDVPAEAGGLAADADRLAFLTVPDRGLSVPVTLVVTRVTPRS